MAESNATASAHDVLGVKPVRVGMRLNLVAPVRLSLDSDIDNDCES